ncbi:MAG: CHAT domain-containing protein [Desulfococcaceae bacterium]
MAKQYIGHGVKNCRRLLYAFDNNSGSDNQTLISLICETEIYLILYQGYIAWFENGKQEEANKIFKPLDNVFSNSKVFKEDKKYDLKYDKNKPIIDNVVEAGADIVAMPFVFTFDKLMDFFFNEERHFLSDILLDRAYFYHKMYGDHEKALTYLDRAIEIGKEMSILYPDLKYTTYMDAFKKKMMIYIELGDLQKASDALDQYNEVAGSNLFKLGKKVFGSIDDFRGYIASYFATGGALFALLRDFDKSKEYFDEAADLIKSLDISTLDENNRYGLATYYVYLGAYYYGLQGEYEKASQLIDEGLSFLTPNYIAAVHNDPDIITAYIHSAEMHLKVANTLKKNPDKHYQIAMRQAETAEQQAEKFHSKIGMGRALSMKGWIEHYKGNNKAASKYFEQALAKVKNISNTDNWDIYFGAGKAYEAMGQKKSALANYKKSIQEIEKLWTGRFKDTYKQVSFIEERLSVFEPLIRLLVKDKKYTEAVAYIEQSKSRSFYESSPYYSGHNIQNADAKWQNVNPLTASQIKKMLPADTALLEYYVGKDAVVCGVITRKNIYFQNLAIQAGELENQVNLFRTAIDKQRTGYANTGELAVCIDHICNTGNDLYKSLVKPFEKKLSGYRHICIIPHGILHYLPFQALAKNRECLDKERFRNSFQVADVRGTGKDTVSGSQKIAENISRPEKTDRKAAKSAFLIEDYTISYAPSATILNIVRENNTKRKNRLLAVGCPPDIKVGKDILPQLTYAKNEIQSVADLFAYQSVFTEKKASETAVKENIGNYDILLFSTHGMLNRQSPLDSFIVFNKDRANDGFLTVKEIESLKLRANLAVLSACESGLTRGLTEENYGDDLFGLQRGFMKSGTTSVLSTLWRADDRSSESLVIGFFDHFIKKGQDKASALRNAQLYIINDENYPHPYYWSHFVLSGDWN